MLQCSAGARCLVAGSVASLVWVALLWAIR